MSATAMKREGSSRPVSGVVRRSRIAGTVPLAAERLPAGSAGYWAVVAPSLSAGTAFRAFGAAMLTALAYMVSHNPVVAVGLLAIAVAVVPHPRLPDRPRQPGLRKSAPGKGWQEQLERDCHVEMLAAYRRGSLPADAVLASFTWLAEWNARHGVDEDDRRRHLQEAIEVAREAGDTAVLVRLQVSL